MTGGQAAKSINVSGRRIVVTGANGFVGRAVCRWFAERGANVVGCVRRREALGDLPRGVETEFLPDPLDRGAWRGVLDGAEAVVHLVARTHIANEGDGALAEYRRTNVEITRSLLVAAIDVGLPRFVFTSSIKAVGEGTGSPYSETTPCRPRDAYGRTKREAELLVRGECWGTRTEATIVRPPLVYGPGVRGNFATLLRTIDRGVPLPLGRVTARRSLVHVGNLADALGHATVHPEAGHRVLHVADDGPAPTIRELVERLAERLGRRPRLLPVPEGLLRVAGRLLGKQGAIDRLTGSLVVGTRELRTRLGWNAPIDAADGLDETVAWYRRQRDVARRAA